MRNRFLLYLSVTTVFSLAIACQKEAIHPDADAIVEKTTPKQALLLVNVNAPTESGIANCEVGVAFGTADEYLTGNIQEILVEKSGDASANLQIILKHLECGTLYRYHTFVRCGDDIYTSETKEFKTDPLPQYAVDLHLSNDLLWADRNVGAADVNDDGDLFAFGEISTKEKYVAKNYKFYTDYNPALAPKITKYIIPDGNEDQLWYNQDGIFSGDGKSVLEIEDDAAAKNMGEGWRLPTADEYKLLTDECKAVIERTSVANGLKLTAPNGTELHLPSSKMFDSDFHSGDGWGHYLTSSVWVGDEKVSIQSANSEYCSCLWFSAANSFNEELNYLLNYPLPRYYGLPARSVYDCSVIPEQQIQWEGVRNIGKKNIPELSDKPNDLVKYGVQTSRMPIIQQTISHNSSNGGYSSITLMAAGGGELFSASLSFDEITNTAEGEELVPRSCYAGFPSSSSTSGTTNRMYGTVRLISKQNGDIRIRFENVRFRVRNEKWVLNGTYSFTEPSL